MKQQCLLWSVWLTWVALPVVALLAFFLSGWPAALAVGRTANLCPFCPLVRARLVGLQERLGFELSEIDVTFRPELVTSKNLRAVPVVEAGGRMWVGNATSAQLLAFLAGAEAGYANERQQQ